MSSAVTSNRPNELRPIFPKLTFDYDITKLVAIIKVSVLFPLFLRLAILLYVPAVSLTNAASANAADSTVGFDSYLCRHSEV